MTAHKRWMVVVALFLGVAHVHADETPTASERAFFETKIRPILAEHCYACHSVEAKKQKGGLRLDDRDSLRKGGDSGPAIVSGKPDESLLIKAVRYVQDDLKMPPKGKLPASAIADLEAWVKMGAPDPRDKPAAVKVAQTWEEMLRTRRNWWSLQPVQKGAVPTVRNAAWSDHPVDRFLLAKLEQTGLHPAAPADPNALIRRLSLVLTGLPPSTTEVEGFARVYGHAKRQAVEDLIDRLLRSPHFGERWARHWLDVVRFTETHGNEWNYDVHHAWRYRDYLIRAFNDDVPFDRLIREHLAGDLLAPRQNEKQQFNEAPIGTAFYRFGEVNHDDCIGLPSLGYDILDNQIDTLTKAFQATTVACARCHDHKIDAVSMKDYYALLGILRSSRMVTHTIDTSDSNAWSPIHQLQALKNELRNTLAQVWRGEIETIDAKRLDALKVDKTTWDHPLHGWVMLRNEKDLPGGWTKLGQGFQAEASRRAEATAQNYASFGDFRRSDLDGWKGQGLGLGEGAPGTFTVAAAGDRLIGNVLPAGWYTHRYSEKLNGTLRSPVLPRNKKRISLHVVGNQQAAARIVSNHCQLNYRNFRVLKSGQWHWITFDIPDEADALRSYAELMTKFDNPKYPDQLGQLGGDDGNQRVPWDKAAADPHSYFGVTHVVVHDVPQPPPDDLAWLGPLFAGAAPQDRTSLATRYRERMRQALQTWENGRATDEDAKWLDWLVQQGVLSNSVKTHATSAKIVQDYRATENRLQLPRIIPGLADQGDGIAQPLFVRGDCKKPGEVVARRYLEVLSPPGRAFVPQGSGRRQLADAIADPANPLTARVMVNRIWHHVFGHGIVRTCDDFGRMGDMPSHPELLDWLAARFVEDGWSVKKMIRLLVTSQAFQMSARADAKAGEVDPLNRLLHHFPARRMEAEAIRDSILAVSGRLDRTMYGLSVLPYREKANEDRRLFPGPLDGNGRRSIYIKVNLMEGARFLSAFDLPGGKVTQGRRDVTNVPAQALALMNDPFVIQQAKMWADSLIQRGAEPTNARVSYMFQVALGRPGTGDEIARFARFAHESAKVHDARMPDIGMNPLVWHDVAHALFNVQEFVYIP